MREVLAVGVLSGDVLPEDVGFSRPNDGNVLEDFDLFESLEDLGNFMPRRWQRQQGKMDNLIGQSLLLSETKTTLALSIVKPTWSASSIIDLVESSENQR